MKTIKSRLPLVAIFLVPLILVLIWFWDGNILGSGESGLPFYSPANEYRIGETAWSGYGLGGPSSILVTSSASYFVLAKLMEFGIPGFVLQAMFFYFCFVIAGLSIYFLTKEFFPDLGSRFLLLSVFFYWFNPFSLVNVWNRFLNNYFVFFFFLPLCLLLVIKGIKAKNYLYVILIGLSSAIFSFVHTSMAFNLIFWFVLSYTVFFYSLFINSFKKKVSVYFFLSLCLAYWILINFWWITQIFNYIQTENFEVNTYSFFTPLGNYSGFNELSEKLGKLTDVFVVRHGSFFHTPNINWRYFFINPLVRFGDFLIVGTILFAVAKRRISFSVLYLLSLFLVGVFLSKGNNLPLGEVFGSLFLDLTFLQLFRNPFEKFGFILPLVLAPLFGFAVYFITQSFRKNFQLLIYSVYAVWMVIIWGFPFFTGLVFTSTSPPSRSNEMGFKVKVPDDYKHASDWLKNQGSEYKIIVLPLFREGITYSWEKGFSGIELTNEILPVQAISLDTTIPLYHDIARELESILLKENGITEHMNALNARYIMLREDVDFRERQMSDPLIIKAMLEERQKRGELKKVVQFGKLSFWENIKWDDPYKNISRYGVVSAPKEDINDLKFLSPGQVLVSTSLVQSLGSDRVDGEIIHPVEKIILSELPDNNKNAPQSVFPFVNILPSNVLYKLVLLKERFIAANMKSFETLVDYRVLLTGKRLIEANMELQRKDLHFAAMALNNYIHQLEELRKLLALNDNFLLKNYFNLNSEQTHKTFYKHKLYLEDFKKNNKDENLQQVVGSAMESLDSFTYFFGINPVFDYSKSGYPIDERVGYRFIVQNLGEYELFWGDHDWKKYFNVNSGDDIQFQLDDNLIAAKVEFAPDNLISLGKYTLKPGTHEISMNALKGVNLIEDKTDKNILVEHEKREVTHSIRDIASSSAYRLDFEYLIKFGKGFVVNVVANNAQKSGGQTVPNWGGYLGSDFYNFQSKKVRFDVGKLFNANSLNLTFTVEPWNNCEDLPRNVSLGRCMDLKYRRQFDLPTGIEIKNVRFYKVMDEKPVLVKVNPVKNLYLPKVELKKVNLAKYQANVQDSKEPFFLILPQLFDSKWRLTPGNGNIKVKGPFVVNAYANGWLIEGEGDYQLILEYLPQKILEFGKRVSSTAGILGLIVLSGYFIRKYVKKI